MLVLAAVLTATAAANAVADQTAPAGQPTPAAGPEVNYTGKVIAVDPQNHTLTVKSWLLSQKEFNLGANCTYSMVGVNTGTANDLRPGQKVTVTYQTSHGVRVADQIREDPLRYEGMVTAINPNNHTLTLREHGFDRTLQIADGCSIALRENKTGALGDIQPGDHVTVTYETPNGQLVARQIAQTSEAFTGRLTAIDLGEKMVKAKGTFDTVKFNLADNCAIVINGRTDGKLSQLRPNERLAFDYNTINGVNVVNRIAPATEQKNSVANTSPTYYPSGEY